MEAISLRGNSNNSKNYNSHNPYISSKKYTNHILPQSQYFHSMGFSPPPPPHYNHILPNSSYPPPYSLQQAPPLLPLPSAATIGRGLSFPPNKKPNNRKKSKSPNHSKNQRKTTTPLKKPQSSDHAAITVSPSRVIPSAGTVVDTHSLNINGCVKAADGNNEGYDLFSGSVIFAISPPPSTLPLPSFSLRPKLIGCKVEAAGVDGGAATDDLRRLHQLR